MLNQCKTLYVLFLIIWALPSIAQVSEAEPPTAAEFSLFENIEVAENRQTPSSSRPTRESRATTSEPVFTLIGTSRIGSNSSAIVRHQSGQIVRVAVNSGAATPIEGYEEYSVFDVGSGSLSVRLPSNIPCVDHKDKGVSCAETSNTARLRLVNAEALARVEAPVSESNPEINGQVVSDGTANPFEALRAARASGQPLQEGVVQESANGRNGRFTPRRIAQEDVPPGMRVVSTPFGDRLVEQ